MEAPFKSITLRCITLHRPWADWVAMEWKTVETRTHRRFQGLLGEVIGIHGSQKWDTGALNLARPYLSAEQIQFTEELRKGYVPGIRSPLICATYVWQYGDFIDPAAGSKAALIDCTKTRRHGLWLRGRLTLTTEPMSGRQGIWMARLPFSEPLAAALENLKTLRLKVTHYDPR